MTTRRSFLFSAVAASLILAACASPAPAAPTSAPAAAAPAATEAPKATDAPAAATDAPKATEAPAMAAGGKDFITWYQYDATNEDPKNDERVGNAYLRETMPVFNKAYAGKYNWVNQTQPFDKMEANLVAAVQSGGEVPDLMQSGGGSLSAFLKNGTVEDLTEWAKAQPWFADLDAASVNACSVDGKLYCIPVSQGPAVVYYWTAYYPNGYPKTPADFMKSAEELAAKKVKAITFFGSTAFDGEGVTRFVWQAISSFGGKFDDGKGKMVLNSPANIKAVEFIREVVAKGYATDETFQGTQTPFVEEEPFKTAAVASFPTGLFGYRYVNPLKSPSGKEFNTKTEKDMLDAIAAGEVALAPFLADEGQKPGCGIGVSGFVVPKGAKNMEAAQAYINWIMTGEQNAKWVQGPGGGFPALKSTLSTPAFKTPFYEQASKVTAASACSPWEGSLDRKAEAKKVIMTAVYKLIKEDPKADIGATLKAAEEEYNKAS